MNPIKIEYEENKIYYNDADRNNILPAMSWQSPDMIKLEKGQDFTASASYNIVSAESNVSEHTPSKPRLRLLDGTFFEYIPSESNASTIVAFCMKCPSYVTKVKGYNNCSSNFLTHLKRKHGQGCVDEYKMHMKRSRCEANTSAAVIRRPRINKSTESQEIFNENIVTFFTSSLIPMKLVEDPHFTRIFSNLDISKMGLDLINRTSLSRYVENNYEKEIASIKSKLRDVDYVCSAVDVCSNGKKRFICVSAHWITNDLRRNSAGIACQKITNSCYGGVSNQIQKINAEFNLDANNLSLITVDDANFTKTLNQIGVELSNINRVENTAIDYISESGIVHNFEDEEFNHQIKSNIDGAQHCCAHSLTQCVTIDAIRVLTQSESEMSHKHFTVMTQCNALWKAAANTTTYAEMTTDVRNSNLSKPNATRWNSLFDALQQILDIKDRLLKFPNVVFTNSDFDYLKEFLTCAAPIKEALDIIQNETNAYYGIILPCLLVLRKKLQKIEEVNIFSYCQPLIQTYRHSVETRFENLFNTNTQQSENAAIAALSYPRFKNKWLSCLEPADRDKLLNNFKTQISKLIRKKRETVRDVNLKLENTFFTFDSDLDNSQTNRNSDDQLNKAELLMLQFFAEESQELDVLNNYPEIKKVFVKYNTHLPSSRGAEGLFSFVKMTNLASDFSEDMFEKRTLLKCNLDYLKK